MKSLLNKCKENVLRVISACSILFLAFIYQIPNTAYASAVGDPSVKIPAFTDLNSVSQSSYYDAITPQGMFLLGLSGGKTGILYKNQNDSNWYYKVISSDGTPPTTPLQINTSSIMGSRATNFQTMKAYSIGNGNVMITWEGGTNGGGAGNIQFAIVGNNGSLVKGATDISTNPSSPYNMYSDAAVLSNGNIVFTWQNTGQQFLMRIFDSSGNAVTQPVAPTNLDQANSTSMYQHKVGANKNGEFLITYSSNSPSDYFYAVLYKNDGTKIKEFTTNIPYNSSYSINKAFGLNNNFAINYQDSGQNNYVEYLDNQGNLITTLSTAALKYNLGYPSFIGLANGDVVVTDSELSGSNYLYYAKEFDENGTIVSDWTPVDSDAEYNSTTFGSGYDGGYSFYNDLTGNLVSHGVTQSSASQPTITTQPVDQTVSVGVSATLSVTASVYDGGTLSYQWYSNTTNSNTNGTLITGATNATLSVPTSTPGTTYYYVIVTNTLNGGTATTTSNVANVTINDLTNAVTPTITTQPTGQTVNAGASASLSVTASVSDGGTLTYQWYSNTTNSNTGGTLIPSVTSATYSPPTTTAGTMYYYVVVTNTNSNATGNTTATARSDAAAVTVNDLTNAEVPSITTQPTDQTVNVGASASLSVVASVGDGGALSYQWYSNTTNSNTGGTPIPSVTSATYSPPTTSVGTMYYYVVVTNTNSGVTGNTTATATSDVVAVTVNNLTNAVAPTITTQPTDQTVNAGASALLGVSASVGDGGTLTYQWYSNTTNSTTGGTAINGATSATYTVPTDMVGTTYYYVIVTNTNSSATGNHTATSPSNVARVTVAPSSNADLSNLTISGGSLTPTIDSNTTEYTANVPNEESSVNVTPTIADSHATVKVNGMDAVSGNSSTVALIQGANTITVDVTAQDGTVKTYTITITRAAASLSSNADLSDLTLSAGTLNPVFASGTTAYNVDVANAVDSVDVTPIVSDSHATVTVNGYAVVSGHAQLVHLNVGSNTITIVVTAQNGSTKTYKVTIDRTGSNNTTLSSLKTSTGTLSPSFQDNVYTYTVGVPNETTALSVTASVYDANASIKVMDTPLLSGQHSGLIPLQVGNNPIPIVVTAQDGTTATYTITANRAASSDVNLSGLVINQGTLTPSFDPETSTYSADVSNSTDSLSVTASVYEPSATIKINGVPVESGTASNPIALQVGSNSIQVLVLAQDGVTSKTYTLNVMRDGHHSDNSSPGTIGGQLTVSTPSSNPSGTSTTETNSPAAFTKMLGSNVSLTATVLTTDGTSIPDITIRPDGQFQIGSNVAAGQYPVVINVTAPDGEVLAGKSGTLTVNSNGTASMKTDLIDPYGIITDSVSKQPIPGVNLQLYWADTDLNRSKGRTPDTVVKLPELPDFAPNKNLNPQVSTTDGRYGWMVFPDGDYYVIAEKDGYETYDSRKDPLDKQEGDTSYIRNGIIHVGKTMVKLNVTMSNKNVETGSIQEGYIKGYPDGTFRPDNQLTRAELASILSRVLPLSTTGKKEVYPDVPATHWAEQTIQNVAGNQVMSGYPNGTFHPDSPITRAEMASIVARVKHLETKQATFGDATNHWASNAIGAVQEAGMMSGYPDGTFRPDQPLTRAEAVTIVNRMLGIETSNAIEQQKWVDVPPSYWAYNQIEAASL